MEQSLKSFLNIHAFLLVPFLICLSCNDTGGVQTVSPNNKLLVIVDQSASISYSQQQEKIPDLLKEKFDDTYKYVTTPTKFYITNITARTNVVPEEFNFLEAIPNHEDFGGISYSQELTKWKAKKNTWIKSGIEKLIHNITIRKRDNTELYPVFQTIEDLGKKLSIRDTLNIIFFSDMKHDTNEYDLLNELLNSDPTTLAQNEFQRIKLKYKIGELSNRFQCLITIVTPDSFQSSSPLIQFWNEFFKLLGVKSSIDWRTGTNFSQS